jgi:Flp pilus assembly pilin Flp
MLAQFIKRFYSDDQGLETVEYAVIVGLIVGGVIVVLAALGQWVLSIYTQVQTEVGA